MANFASAVKDENPVYHDAATRPRPPGSATSRRRPTFSFAMQYWGKFAEDQPADPTGGENPMHKVMGELFAKGGLVLHGEQEFEYHRPIVVGDVLVGEGASSTSTRRRARARR